MFLKNVRDFCTPLAQHLVTRLLRYFQYLYVFCVPIQYKNGNFLSCQYKSIRRGSDIKMRTFAFTVPSCTYDDVDIRRSTFF